MTSRKEQWEALIIETSHWSRIRNIDDTGKGRRVVFDEEDMRTIDDDLMNGFKQMGGFEADPRNMTDFKHPVARFYELFYTEFGDRTLEKLFGENDGIAGYSTGVKQLFIDQMIRYMVFVELDTMAAYRFAQLICSVAVFRNTFDDNTKKFIEKGLLATRKRFFKPSNMVVDTKTRTPTREIGPIEPVKYISLESYGIDGDYPEDIANNIKDNYRSEISIRIRDVLDVEEYGKYDMEGITLTNPLKVNTSVYSTVRKFVLHVMHLLVNLVTVAPSSVDIVYVGTADSSCFNSLRDVIPSGYNFLQGIDKINPDNITLVILDEENDKEASCSAGDDSQFTYQISLVKGIVKSFKNRNLLGISMNFRVPNTSDGNGKFMFCPGDIYLTPWKNPSDDRMRLVWSPKYENIDTVYYDVKMVDSARKYQDYIVRSLYTFETEPLDDKYMPIGLIDGEFDSELEKFIVDRYYGKFPEGNQLWNSVADMDTNIIVPPRFIGEKIFHNYVGALNKYYNFIIKYHLDIPSNPMLVHASRCARSGLFCVSDIKPTPVTESIEMLFGGDQDQAMQTYELYERISDEYNNIIRMINEKKIFSGFKQDPSLLIDIVKEKTKNFKDIIRSEPYIQYGDDFEYQVFGNLRAGSVVNIVQLGDSFGGILNVLNGKLDSRKIAVGGVIYEGTFSIEDIAKYIFEGYSPPIVRVKNVYEIKPLIDKAAVPFVLVKGIGYPEEIYESFVNSWKRSELYRGALEVSSNLEVVVRLPPRTVSPREQFDRVVSKALVNGVSDGNKKQGYRSCLFIGSDLEDNLSYLSETGCTRIFHMVESGYGGKKVVDMTRLSRKINHRVFVNETMYSNFVLPVDMVFDVIICHPISFTRFMRSEDIFSRFLSEVSNGFGKDTMFKTVDLSELIDYASRNSSQNYSYGSYFTNNLFDVVVGDNTFTLNGKQGTFGKTFGDYKFELRYSGLVYVQSDGYERERYEDRYDEEDVEDTYREEEEDYRGGSVPSDYMSISTLNKFLQEIKLFRKSDGGYQPEAYEAYEANVIDVGKGVREYNNLVKRDLINAVKTRTRILDLACGHGQDISKWFSDETVEMYIGMDGSQREIEEAETRLRSRRSFKPKNTKFLVRDLFGSQGWVFDAQDFLRYTDLYSAISCQLAIHYAFVDEKTIKRFMYNVSNLLELDGEFIVTTLDDSVIRSLVEAESQTLNSLDKVTIEGEYYKITLPQDTLKKLMSSEVVAPGASYEFIQFPSDPKSRKTTEYVVDSRYFKALAADMGLELVSSENFTSLGSLKEDFEKLSRDDVQVVAFYKTYRFRKIADAKFGMTIFETPMFKYSESKNQLDRTNEIINKTVAEGVPSSEKFSTGLFLKPETLFPAPYMSQSYERIDVLVEDINQVRTIAKQLQIKGRITEKENILINRLPSNTSYDFIYVPYTISNERDLENLVLNRLTENGVVYGNYVDIDRINALTTPVGYEFSNFIFEVNVDRQKNIFSINKSIDVEFSPLFDRERIQNMLTKYNLELSVYNLDVKEYQTLNQNQKQYIDLFGMYKISKKMEVRETVVPKPAAAEEDELSTMMEGLTTVEPSSSEDVDKFVLLPGLVQKKAPGKGRDESLSSKTSKNMYKDLAADPRWRFKLSDDWESREFVIRMPTGEEFESVTRALVYYKCEFAEEPNQEYKALNLASGMPQPSDLKPFTKAIRGKKGVEWKQREQVVLKKIYEAKFTNTPNVINDDPENLSPLQALLMTKDAQLYSNSKTRNELLETVRNTLKNIVNI